MNVFGHDSFVSESRRMRNGDIFSNELINYHIISNISHYLPQEDLHNISLLNWHFYHLTIPYLYRSITITESQHVETLNTTYIRTTDSRSSLHNCKILLQSLLLNPGLIKYIHHLKISQDVWFKDVINDIVDMIISNDKNMLKSIKCDHEHLIWNAYNDKACYRCCKISRQQLLTGGRNQLILLQIQGDEEWQELVRCGGKSDFAGLKILEINGEKRNIRNVGGVLQKGVNSILKNLEEMVILYEPYWFIMNNIDCCLPMTKIQRMSIDRCVTSNSNLIENFEQYYAKENFLIKNCPLLEQVRYRFKFESFEFFENYLVKFLSNLPNSIKLELIISIKKIFKYEDVINQCYNILQKIGITRFKLIIYNNCNEFYTDNK